MCRLQTHFIIFRHTAISFGSVPWCCALLPLHRPPLLMTHRSRCGCDSSATELCILPLMSKTTQAGSCTHVGILSFSWKEVALCFTCWGVFILVTIKYFVLNGLTLLQNQANIWNVNERPRQNRLKDLLEKLQNQPRCRRERLWRECSVYLCCGKHIVFIRKKCWRVFSLGSFRVIYFE